MKSPVPILIALLALVAAAFLFWPTAQPEPVLDPGIAAEQAEQEARRMAELDELAQATEQLREFAGRFDEVNQAGAIATAQREDGEGLLRAMNTAGEVARPALFLARGQNGQIEWLTSESGELRLENLRPVRSVAAFAEGHWSSAVLLDHDLASHESIELHVHQAAASLTVQVALEGQGPASNATCFYTYATQRPNASLDELFTGEEFVQEVESTMDASGIGTDDSLFSDAFSRNDPSDARTQLEDGLLELKDLPPAHYRLWASSPEGVGAERWITLAPGAVEQVEFTLVLGGFVVGEVASREGEAVPAAKVGAAAMDAAFADFVGERQLLERLEWGAVDGRSLALVDEEGRYRLGPLAPGKVRVMAAAEGWLPGRAGEVEIQAGLETQASPIQLSQGHALTAWVRDASTGEVLQEAEVYWRGAGESIFDLVAGWAGSEERDDLGRPVLRNLPFQPLQLEARAEGYAAFRQEYLMTESAWIPGSALPELEFLLEEGRQLDGQVLGPDGLPVADAEVMVVPADEDGNVAGLFGMLSSDYPTSTSDQDGRFRFKYLPRGEYIVHARAQPHAPGRSEAVDLSELQAASTEVRLPAAGSLLVRYLDEDGAPGASQVVIVTHLSLALPAQQVTDENGEARFDQLAAGDYNLQTIAAGATSESFSSGEFQLGLTYFRLLAGEQKVLEVGPGLADASLSGRLTEDGQAAGGVSVTLLGGGQISSKRTDEDGAYSFDRLVPQTYTVLLGSTQSASHATELTLESGENQFDYELPAGGLEVRVVRASDGSPAVGTPVTVTSEDSLGNPVFTMTDGEGRAVFRFLAPGPYHVSAGTAAMPLFGGDGTLGARSTDVTIGSTRQQIELRLEEAATFRVRVLGLDGQPLAGASMFYLRDDGQPLGSLSMKATNSKGVAQLEGLPAGPGRILIKHPTGGQIEFPISLTAGQLSKQEVQLEEGVTVWLRVLDASGEPATGVLATLRNDRGVRISMLYSMQDAQEVNQAYFAGQEQRLGPVAPGRYTVEVFRLGGKMLREVIEVPAGSPEVRRTFVYRPE